MDIDVINRTLELLGFLVCSGGVCRLSRVKCFEPLELEA